jgi:hypothetical protein
MLDMSNLPQKYTIHRMDLLILVEYQSQPQITITTESKIFNY